MSPGKYTLTYQAENYSEVKVEEVMVAAGDTTEASTVMANKSVVTTVEVNELRPFDYSDPDFRGRFGSPIFRAGWVSAPDDGFFDQTATFIGGIGDEDWTEEWTSFIVDTEL